jgi:hypothetical protein
MLSNRRSLLVVCLPACVAACHDARYCYCCIQSGLLWYPNCLSDYYPFTANICSPVCPDGWTDIGVSCAKICDGCCVFGVCTCNCRSCPSDDWHDDGLYCAKPAAIGNGAGYGVRVSTDCISAQQNCEQDQGAGNCFQAGLLWYTNCSSGWFTVMLY